MADAISGYQMLRIGGLASGLDTDTMIEDMMKAEEAKVFKIEQQKIMTEWQQEAYRSIIDKLKTFSDEHFNLLAADKNIMSATSYKASSVTGAQGVLSLITSGSAINGNYTINSVQQLASASVVQSSARCVEYITSGRDLSEAESIAMSGKAFELRLDDMQLRLSFDQDYTNLADLADAMQQKIDAAFGSGRVEVSIVDGKYLALNADNSRLQIFGDVTAGTWEENIAGVTELGFEVGDLNMVNTNASLYETFGEEAEQVSFKINGVQFTFKSHLFSIENIMQEINKSEAGVTITYSSMDDRFTIKSNQSGAASEIKIENLTGNVFGEDGYFKIDSGSVRNGQDAVFYYNDPTLSNPIRRSSNVFTIDGVTVSLQKTTTEAVSYKVYDDVDKAQEKIEKFIDSYNSLLQELGMLIWQKKDRDYAPLSDKQKEEMSETEITKWEAKAKEGILNSDPLLWRMYTELRNAFLNKIEGAELSFFEIGVASTKDNKYGQLEIDDAKLRTALEKNLAGVMELFTKSSDVGYSRDLTSAKAAERFNENGLGERVNDIIRNYITTKRDVNGNKGFLIEKAGLAGDTTEYTNALTKELQKIKEKIETATERMNKKEDQYWRQFAALEQSINILNSQSSWFNSMLGNK